MKKIKRYLAVFDIDGTIFRKNLQFELLNGLAYEGIFSMKTKDFLVERYRKWLNNKDSYEVYRDALITHYKKELKGKSKEKVVMVAKKVASFHHERIFLYAKEMIEQLRKDYLLLAISGSPIEIVRKFNRYLKFDDVFGTVYEIDKHKKYTGREIFTPVHNKAKVLKRYVAEQGISLKKSIAIGDTESDIPMLKVVDKPIAFNPDVNLYEYAKKKKWEIFVERKDMVYKIKS
jgi:HAD superfamily hydrolase (TIGR01490 family)